MQGNQVYRMLTRHFAGFVIIFSILCIYILWTGKQLWDYDCNFENYVLGQHIDQEDPCLLATFKKKMLIPPSSPKFMIRTQKSDNQELPMNKQKFEWVKKLLVERLGIKAGFFVELGANDGDFISPTGRIERELNWFGLLVEAMPAPFKVLLTRKRNTWAVNAAACVHPYPEQVSIYYNPNNYAVSGFKAQTQFGVSSNTKVKVQCVPLYTMLKAVDKTEVDYLSLDVEGFELAVLKTLPWDKVSFKMMTIEDKWIREGLHSLQKYLAEKGYKYVRHMRDVATHDSLYVKESLFEDAKAVNNTIV